MICIYGTGKVGVGVAQLCDQIGLDYDLVDDSINTPQNFDKYDVIIPSPGIPPTHRLWVEGPKVVSELDFAYAHLPTGAFRIFSVTGTDGKSTTCKILHSLLDTNLQHTVYITGNYDQPFSACVAEVVQKGITCADFVVEISSFMAYAMRDFTSDATIVTNLVQDHLDWHPNKDDYFRSKFRLVENTSGPVVLLEQTYLQEKTMFDEWHGEYVLTNATNAGENYVGGNNEIILGGDSQINEFEHLFSGPYNAQNILHAALLAQIAGVPISQIAGSLEEVAGIEHRQEFVAEIEGRIFVNDSKSTSALSQRAALEGQKDGRVILIMGGKDKGDRFNGLDKLWKQKIKHALLIGQMTEYLSERLRDSNIPHVKCSTLEKAVSEAWKISESGDTILLAPGCASLDMFPSYMKRGEEFKQLVENLW